jgi:hypothetical protein
MVNAEVPDVTPISMAGARQRLEPFFPLNPNNRPCPQDTNITSRDIFREAYLTLAEKHSKLQDDHTNLLIENNKAIRIITELTRENTVLIKEQREFIKRVSS